MPLTAEYKARLEATAASVRSERRAGRAARFGIGLAATLAVLAVFIGLGTVISSSGGDPYGGMSAKGAGYALLALSIGIVWAGVAIVRHRRRIAAKAGDLSIDALATSVKLSRAAKGRLTSLRDRINERAD